MGYLTLLVTSPRVAPGLLTRAAWRALQEADALYAADLDPVWGQVLVAEDLQVIDVAEQPVRARARLLVEAATASSVVWFGSPDADPGLTDALAEELSRLALSGPVPTVELLTGSHDVPGARLLDVVAVMDRLRSPGGCPWDAEQTHESLLPYLLEETHEVIEAAQSGDRAHLAEELGDLLLQVVFHARIAAEHEAAPFDIDEVAGGLVAKLVRRHPHVFAAGAAGAEGETGADLDRQWDELKAAEKPSRGLLEGIPPTLPSLARGQKVFSRLAKSDPSGAALEQARAQSLADPATAEVTAALFEAVEAARRAGVDAEAHFRGLLTAIIASTASD